MSWCMRALEAVGGSVIHGCAHGTVFGGSREIRIKQTRWGVLCQVVCTQNNQVPAWPEERQRRDSTYTLGG